MSVNTLSVFDPIFYAQQALIQLEKALGMAGRVYRGYDKTPQQIGSTISIQKPSTFVAQVAPGADQNIVADAVNIVLNQWKEVKFALTDKEMSYTGPEIIEKHIRPAAYALADDIDQFLCKLALDVPWFSGTGGVTPSAVTDITTARKVLFNNKVPLGDPSMVHLMVDGNAEANFLALAAFSQQQGAGDVGVATQLRGTLGTKYGLEVFANQNVQPFVKGTWSTSALVTSGAGAIGNTSMVLGAGAVTGTLVHGDILQVAGDLQNYVVIGGPYTAAGNSFGAVSILPKLQTAPGNGTAVTVVSANATLNLGYHRNAFALAMAPLSDMANQLGAKVATVQDPVTGLTLRSRVWYVGDNSAVKVGLDVLYGGLTLDPNLAMIMRG